MSELRSSLYLAAVPQIKEIVPQNEKVVVIDLDSDSESSCNDSQAEEEEEQDATEASTPQPAVIYCVNPTHVKALDDEAKVEPISMFEDTTHSPQDLVWDDEAEDETVDSMVRLIKEGSTFQKEMFVGELTAAELSRIRAENKHKEKDSP